MPPYEICKKCGREVRHAWYCSNIRGLLCDDCNLEWGIFESIVVDVMLGFANYLVWNYSRRKFVVVPNLKGYGNIYDKAWMEGALAV